MFSSQVISGISGGVLGIAGLLLVMSSMKQRRVDWRIGIGVPLFGLGLFILVTELPQYALGLSILATLAMAFAALLNIKQSADRENRDRRERLLNAIIDWATNVAKSSLEKGVFDESIPIEELPAERALPELLDSVVAFRMARAESLHVSNVAAEIDSILKKEIEKLVEGLKEQISFLMKYKRQQPTPIHPAEPVVKEIAKNNEELYSLAATVIEKASEILKRDLPAK